MAADWKVGNTAVYETKYNSSLSFTAHTFFLQMSPVLHATTFCCKMKR